MASTTKPVVVYGASGYTGRLVCEYLREYGVPFIAAGRSADRIRSSMETNVSGIETADYEVAEVTHDVGSLTDLFSGASVVLNTVGPFSQFGPEVVQAALAAGCHYTDTTGEQDWLMTCDDKYGADFAAAGLLLSPGIAQMYTTSEIAAQLCLETPAWTRSTSRCSGVAARPSPRPARSWSTPRPRPRTTWSTTSTCRSTRARAWCPSSSPGSTSWPCPCPGAACRTRSGSSATRGWPTSRPRAGSSTPR